MSAERSLELVFENQSVEEPEYVRVNREAKNDTFVVYHPIPEERLAAIRESKKRKIESGEIRLSSGQTNYSR